MGGERSARRRRYEFESVRRSASPTGGEGSMRGSGGKWSPKMWGAAGSELPVVCAEE
jgi:hypothetical protein